MSNLKALKDNVLFVWVDQITGKKEFNTSGLIIERKLDRTRDRWGKVIAVGPLTEFLFVGDYILPEKTHEPFGGNHLVSSLDQNIEVWMAKEKDILVYSDDESVTHSLNGSDLLFNIKDVSTRT